MYNSYGHLQHLHWLRIDASQHILIHSDDVLSSRDDQDFYHDSSQLEVQLFELLSHFKFHTDPNPQSF